MTDTSKTIASTERLIVREANISDAEFIFELVNTPKWIQNIGDKNIHNLQDAENYIKDKFIKNYKELGFFFYIVDLKEINSPIGISGFFKRDYLEHPDIGFAVLPTYEGKGYSYEAAMACLDYGINKLKFTTICGITSFENTPSQNLLKKLGLNYLKKVVEPSTNETLKLFCRRF